MARLGPAIHVLVVAQESTTVKLQSLTGIGLMTHVSTKEAKCPPRGKLGRTVNVPQIGFGCGCGVP